jgi:hypothetical protein
VDRIRTAAEKLGRTIDMTPYVSTEA